MWSMTRKNPWWKSLLAPLNDLDINILTPTNKATTAKLKICGDKIILTFGGRVTNDQVTKFLEAINTTTEDFSLLLEEEF